MDLSKMSVTEIKAVAYEQVVLLGQTQRNIQILEAEIAKRGQEQTGPVEVKNTSAESIPN